MGKMSIQEKEKKMTGSWPKLTYLQGPLQRASGTSYGLSSFSSILKTGNKM
jgi:hypothetical protein